MAASTNLTPEQRSLRASAAAHYSWAKTTDRSAKGRRSVEVRLVRLEHELDPAGALSAAERRRRAESALRASMKLLALKSARARAARASR